jgi:DNA-binding NtrC family response regulator
VLSEPPREEIDLTGYCVWVVEDDELVRNALQAYMGQLGCEHRMVTSAEELRALDPGIEGPDFAILDDMLGAEESGLELAHWLAERMGHSRILLTTGSGNSVRWRELSESGFAALRKPVSAAALTQWLSSQLKIAA